MRFTLLATIVAGMLATPVFAKTYTIDAGHSSVLFKVKHLGVAGLYGRFNSFEGTVEINEETGDLEAVNVVVKTDSIDTGIVRRDNHLRGEDFFLAAQFPNLTFNSTAVAAREEGGYKLTGNLTIHGVTKVVELVVLKSGETIFESARGNFHKVGAEGTLAIKRSDYGMNKLLEAASDDVDLIMSFELSAPVE